MLRYFTAGESHGEALIAFLSGVPAGLKIDQPFLDRELWRRQQGYGRGGRMKIETDTAHILSGVRHGITIGSPISLQIANRDWKNWQESLPVADGDPAKHKRVASPRPGHADLAGMQKYGFTDARDVLERAGVSASPVRVAQAYLELAVLVRALQGLADMARIEAIPDRSSLWAGLFDLRENLERAALDLRALAA